MREMKSTLFSAFYVCILFIAGLSAAITQGPSNAVAEIGKQVKLYCTAEAPIAYWYLSIDASASGDFRIVGPGCGAVNAPFGNHYTIESIAGGTTCNLNIYDITMEQAGVYKCAEGPNTLGSIFTVIDPNPSITVTNGSGVVAGDQVIMSYTMRYNSSTSTQSSQTPTILPVLTWTDSDGNNILGSPTPGTNSVTSSISVTAGRQAIKPYTCTISYEIKGASTGNGISFADNIPNSVSTPLRTPTTDVVYPPEIESITKSENVPKCPGDTVTITCYASANPPATYSWIGPDSRNDSGPTVAADKNGVYTCTASNAIHGSMRFDTNKTTLNVLCWFWLLLLLWFLNPIAAAIFLIHYKCSQLRNDYNERYLFLHKMLPFINESQETPCMKAGWIILFIVMVSFSGIQFLILTIVTFVGCKNRENGRVDGNGCAPNPGTTERKYVRKSVDETAMQGMAQNTKQTNKKKANATKSEKRKPGKSTIQDQSTNETSEEQSRASHATGTRFQKICFALALAYMILGMILFAISVGVIYYECNRQCNK